MPHIFISYAKKDTRTLAESLLRELTALPGVTAWMDRSLEAGSSWASQIESEIDRADYVIVLLSPDVNRKPTDTISRSFVLNELDFAQQERKPILPVMVQRTRSPLQLAGVQHIDLTASPNSPAPIVDHIRQRFNIPTPPPSRSSKSVGTTPALSEKPTVIPVARRSSFPIPVIVIVLIVLIGGALFFILPSLTTQTTPTPSTVGTPIGAGASDETDSPTPYATLDPTVAFDNTREAAIDAQFAADAAVRLALTPVAQNADWTPVEQDFDGVTMVLVPTGCFQMGSDPISGSVVEPSIPDGGEQCFDSAFWIDKFEVTNTQFNSVGGTAERQSSDMSAQQPRETISWFEARDFCQRRGARLPTEREWEYAARGPDELFYPWGNEFISDNAVFDIAATAPNTENVGSRPAGVSWVGAMDLSGNVWEWTSTIYTIQQDGDDQPYAYPYAPYDGREQDSESTAYLRVLRGGSWSSPGNNLRATGRLGFNPDYVADYIGFRCARSAIPPAPALGG